MNEKEYDTAMEPYWSRMWWNVRHVFDRNATNPYLASEEHGVDDARTGFQDLFHSIKNIWKESRRLKGKSKWIP